MFSRRSARHRRGVLAVDSASRVSVRNDEAERLLGTPLPVGSPPLSDWTCPPRLHQAVAEGHTVDNLLAVVAGNPGCW
jgi:two-component system CitB family sensor kinase